MKKLGLLLIITFFISMPVYAGKMMVGEQDFLKKIQDVSYKSPKGESLYLGYRTTITWFIAGIYLKDQGYILGIGDPSKDGYYSLDEKLISELQSDDYLPKILPEYKIDIVLYLMGYSLWIMILAIVIYYKIKGLIINARNKKRSESA